MKMFVSLKTRILIPLILALALLLGVFISSVYFTERKELSALLERQLKSVRELLERQVDSEGRSLGTAIDLLSLNPQLQAAWLSKNRDALLKLTLPLLEELRAKHQITHFYFHDTNRLNFLRVHDQKRHGDLIDRFTMKEAQQTGRVSEGIELGSLGTLTLRVVHPWRINGKLAGYIEMGEELGPLIKRLHKILGVDLYVSIYKKFITRENWESGMRMLGRQGIWDQLPSSVIIGKTLDEVPEAITDLHEIHHEYYENLAISNNREWFVEDSSYRVGFIPLYDAGKRNIGDLVVLYDVTDQVVNIRNHIFVVSGTCAVIGLFLFMVFSKYPSIYQAEGWAEIISSPFQLVFIMTVSIFVVEGLIMLFLSYMQTLPVFAQIFIDAASLILLISPVLYFFLFRPLIGYNLKNKRIIQELQESEKQTRTIVEVALDAVVTMDSDGLITGWNKQAENIFGWLDSEVLGEETVSIIIPSQYRKAHIDGLKRFLSTRESRVLGKRLELAAIHRDGHEFPIEISISEPVQLARTLVFSAFIRDITERKQAENDLKTAQKVSEKANRAKSDFLANMSHEIRTPMNAIMGMTDITLDTELTRDQRRYLSMVKNSADELLTLINNILDFSKIEACKLDLENIDFNLRVSLENMIDILHLRADEKGLGLECHIHPEVPDALAGDPGRLRQILVNLVGNAIKFTSQGGIVLYVETYSQSEDKASLHFIVKDTGIGIPSDKKVLIFNPFLQADSSMTRQYGGTGLGLTICDQLVKMMNGRIWVESEEGRGSTFHFTADFELRKLSKEKPAQASLEDLCGLPVLVVESNAGIRNLLIELLTNWRMKPEVAASGQEALSSMKRARKAGKTFSLVILDTHLPVMDGFNLAERVKQKSEFGPVTIIMLTSSGQRGDAARCRQLGISGYLNKPVRQSELLEVILTVFGYAIPEREPSSLVTLHSLRENKRHLHILVADDHPANQELAVIILNKWGHTVVTADNGKKALAALEKESFDLVLMDVQMPEMDGLAATAAIRKKEEETGLHLPIIAMTAHALKEDSERCLKAGMDGYVSKPIQVGILFKAIEGLFSAKPQAETGTTSPAKQFDFDKNKLLDRMEGDREFCKTTINIFLDDYQAMLYEIKDGINRLDSQAVEQGAHKLKGWIGYFDSGSIFEAALKLETSGKSNNLEQAEETFEVLENAIKRLAPILEKVCDELYT